MANSMSTFTILLIALLTILPSLTLSACCQPRAYGGMIYGFCGDGTHMTPCCGYDKCNAVCCKCRGVHIGRQPAMRTYSAHGHASYSQYGATITANCGDIWYCRENRLEGKYKPTSQCATYAKRTDVAEPTITSATYELLDGRDIGAEASEAEALETLAAFERLSEGQGNITIEQYLKNWKYHGNVPEGDLKNSIIEKFRAYDVNNDGVMDFVEFQILA